MNKIKTKVSRETNYIYHMLSVAKCGYDNEYGNKYLSKHLPEDLKILKENESLITVRGGEHCGELYHWLVSVPASLSIEATLYYESLGHLFRTGNIDENIKQYESVYKLFLPTNEPNFTDIVCDFYNFYIKFDVIVPICEVMIRNYSIYCNEIWEATKQELFQYAKDIEDIFNKNGFSQKLEQIMNEKLKTEFIATFCNSLDGGAEAIDISESQDVFGIGRNYEWAVKFISHEFIIYLLKNALVNTTAFKELKYWLYTESLAEFYLSFAGEAGGFKECQDIAWFYKEIYQDNNALSAPDLYNKAVERFIGVRYTAEEIRNNLE